jgi:hypothetical protein
MRRAVVAVLVLIAVAASLAGCSSRSAVNFDEALLWNNPVGHVSTRDVESIRKGMTYREIIARLGPTKDTGSGLHIAVYIVDGSKTMYFSFASSDDACPKSGNELLQSAQPIVDDGTIGIRGVVKDIVQGKDGITMLVEGKKEQDTAYDKASVTVNMTSVVFRGKTPVTSEFAFSEIKVGDTVEVVFDGPVSQSYPVMGVARTLRIMSEP